MSPPVVFISVGTIPRRKARSGAEVRAYQDLSALRRIYGAVPVVAAEEHRAEWDDDGPVTFVEGYRFQPMLDLWLNSEYRRSLAKAIENSIPAKARALFCEHWHSLAVAPTSRPIVYSSHDLESKLMPVRWLAAGKERTLKRRIYLHMLATAEQRLVAKASSVLSVSATEAEEFRRRFKKPARYMPIVDESIVIEGMQKPADQARLWFYGASGASANKLMLKHIQEQLYGRLATQLPGIQLHQVGSMTKYDAARREWLMAHFVAHGFVDEPRRLFRAGDICLIPYQHDTGFRTKIPELLALGIIPAGYPISFACCPELRQDFNCIVGAGPDQLVDQIRLACEEPGRREALLRNCQETALRMVDRKATDEVLGAVLRQALD